MHFLLPVPRMTRRRRLFVLLFALLAPCLTLIGPAAHAREVGTYTRNVAIVLYNGVELLDFAGPGEVFKTAAQFGSDGETPAYRVYTVASTRTPIVSQGFVTITPEFDLQNAPVPDLVVLPGGSSSALTGDAAFMAWLARVAPDAELLFSVCTGAMVLGRAGLLIGLEATTWYGALDRLQAVAPDISVQRGRRFVDAGRVVTTAGVSAGIDGALHVVARLNGRWVADRTAQYMEYRWTPEPYLLNGYSYLNPSLDEKGRRFQQGMIYRGEGNWPAMQEIFSQIVRESPGNAEAWNQLGYAYHVQKAYDRAADAFGKAGRDPKLRATALYNLACARALQGRGGEALKALEQSVDAGFRDRAGIEQEPDLQGIRGDERYQALLRRL